MDTGAASGLGRATGLALAEAGAHVTAMASAFERHGDAFDILINVAGIDLPGYASDMVLYEFERVLGVNLTGPTFLISEFIKRIKDRRGDRLAEIVNVISLSAITVGSGAAAYNGSKAAFAKVTERFQPPTAYGLRPEPGRRGPQGARLPAVTSGRRGPLLGSGAGYRTPVRDYQRRAGITEDTGTEVLPA
jgi:NAD(P)-dependent dehydrogenase (short-subunit alcohol dehydrogenase family)